MASFKSKHDRPLKRGRTDRVTLFAGSPATDDSFAKFLVMSSSDEHRPLRKASPFAVARELRAILGPKFSVKKLSSGDLLVEVETRTQSEALQFVKEIAKHEVTVSAHRTLNTRLGVVSDDDLMDFTEIEVLEGLQQEKANVIAVRRIKIRRNDEEIPTKHLVLTFNSTKLPETIHLGYLNLRVRPYIPNPRRCFRCQRFGHSLQTCRGKITCAICASNEHDSDACDNENVKCANCGEAHPAYSRKCSRFKLEKDLLTLKVKENLTFQEARRRLSFLQKGSFAEVARRGAEPPQPPVPTQVTPLNRAVPQPPKEREPRAELVAPKKNSVATRPPQDNLGSSSAAPLQRQAETQPAPQRESKSRALQKSAVFKTAKDIDDTPCRGVKPMEVSSEGSQEAPGPPTPQGRNNTTKKKECSKSTPPASTK